VLLLRTTGDSAQRTIFFQQTLKLVGDMYNAGVKLLAGTDLASNFLMPGFSLHDELSLMVEAGLSPFAALQTATINPARFLHREQELGTVEKGKLADLVLLDDNPLDNINNTRKIYAVIVNGILVQRSDLDNMLLKVENDVK
jgi:imidazolonepropionase-like amidohydrolase